MLIEDELSLLAEDEEEEVKTPKKSKKRPKKSKRPAVGDVLGLSPKTESKKPIGVDPPSKPSESSPKKPSSKKPKGKLWRSH